MQIATAYIQKVYSYNQKQLKKAAQEDSYQIQQRRDQEIADSLLEDDEKKQKKIESYMDACDDFKKESDHDYVS